jgi:hypothetical protein
MNLKSTSQTMIPLSTWKLLGDNRRSYLTINVQGEQFFDVAVVPTGEEPDDYWLDGVGGTDKLDIPHSGDIYFRDTNNQGDETIRTISNIPCVFEQVI